MPGSKWHEWCPMAKGCEIFSKSSRKRIIPQLRIVESHVLSSTYVLFGTSTGIGLHGEK